jgi:hypothetical protein
MAVAALGGINLRVPPSSRCRLRTSRLKLVSASMEGVEVPRTVDVDHLIHSAIRIVSARHRGHDSAGHGRHELGAAASATRTLAVSSMMTR